AAVRGGPYPSIAVGETRPRAPPPPPAAEVRAGRRQRWFRGRAAGDDADAPAIVSVRLREWLSVYRSRRGGGRRERRATLRGRRRAADGVPTVGRPRSVDD